MKDYRKDELRAKWNQMDSQQKGKIVGALVAVVVLLFVISPGFLVAAMIIGVVLSIVKANSDKEKKQEDQRSIGFASPEISVRSLPAKQGYTEDDIDNEEADRINAMNVPPVVKYKLIQIVADDGGTLEDVLDNPDVPDVLKRYVETYLAQEGASASKKQGFDVDTTFKKPKKKEEELYNSDEYESANVDLSTFGPDTMIVNGKPVNFKNRKNPFEM